MSKLGFSLSVLALVVGGLTACTPKDPAVLSPQEKEDQLNRRSKKKGAASDAGTADSSGLTPSNVDLQYAELSIQKMNEIGQYLKLALDLVEKPESLPVAPNRVCKKMDHVVKAEGSQIFVDIIEEGCESIISEVSIHKKQKVQMLIQAPDGKLKTMEVRTLGNGDESAFGRRFSYKRKGQDKRRLDVQEGIDIRISRDLSVETERYVILQRQAMASKQFGIKNEQSNMTLGIEGLITVERQLREGQRSEKTLKPELTSNLQMHLSNDSARTYFSISLSQDPQVKSTEISCANQASGYKLNFLYKPDQSRKNAQLVKTNQGLKVQDEKSKAQIETSCDKEEVSWDKILFL